MGKYSKAISSLVTGLVAFGAALGFLEPSTEESVAGALMVILNTVGVWWFANK